MRYWCELYLIPLLALLALLSLKEKRLNLRQALWKAFCEYANYALVLKLDQYSQCAPGKVKRGREHTKALRMGGVGWGWRWRWRWCRRGKAGWKEENAREETHLVSAAKEPIRGRQETQGLSIQTLLRLGRCVCVCVCVWTYILTYHHFHGKSRPHIRTHLNTKLSCFPFVLVCFKFSTHFTNYRCTTQQKCQMCFLWCGVEPLKKASVTVS